MHIRTIRFGLICFWFCLAVASSAEILPPGFRPLPPGVHAIVGGKVVIKPGEVLDRANIVIRDGRIENVGKDIQPPADARIWDAKGLTIYAGFIDPYLTLGSASSAPSPIKKGEGLTSGRFFGVPGSELDPGNPGPGPLNSLIAPERRVAEAYSPDPKLLEKLRELGFTAANIVPEKGIFRGASAFVQLATADPTKAIIKADVFQHVAFNNEGAKEGAFPESLMGIIAAVRQTFFDAGHYRAAQAAYDKDPSQKRPAFNPSLAALRPAQEKKMPVVFQPESAQMVDRAARVAREVGVDFIVVSCGEEWRWPELAKGTSVPFIVPIAFPEVSKMAEDDDWDQLTLDQLRAWDWAPENAALLRKQGLEIALTTFGIADKKNFRRNLRGAMERGLSTDDALAALTIIPAKLCGVENQLGSIEKGKVANFTIVQGDYFAADSKVREVWIDGRNYHIEPPKSEAAKKEGKPEGEKEKPEKDKKEAEQKEALKKRVARAPLEGRGPITNPPAILVRNATIWTSGPKGVLTNAWIEIAGAKIRELGTEPAPAPAPDALVIDAAGKHVTAGIIDSHSHAAILGDVNEGTIPSSAMVRIGDVVNADTENIYEELAGGTTMANLLHGSANPIGGQNQPIKLREGAPPEELKFDGAVPGIKFALGENVKQSNWGEKFTTRFPQSRMGVRTLIRNRFVAAQEYLKEWEQFRAKGGPEPRRDLELEAIGEIIQGKRIIHCHAYRQDEILMLIRLMQEFGVRIASFEHVLEGYKVADEMAASGVGGSTFADWWAYKFEVYDAIPYNGALMHDRGVVVSFNSDSPDLARRLNLEAAKAVKFGNVPEEEALKFVTLNAAKQMHIENRVGSLEPGKDADFVIWSGNPLDSASVCLETWIDGKKYFGRVESASRAEALENEHQSLIAKAKKVLNLAASSGEQPDAAGKKKLFEQSIEHQYDHRGGDCLRHFAESD